MCRATPHSSYPGWALTYTEVGAWNKFVGGLYGKSDFVPATDFRIAIPESQTR